MAVTPQTCKLQIWEAFALSRSEKLIKTSLRNSWDIGGTAKRILSLAARYADIVGIGFAAWGEQAGGVTPEVIAEKVAWVREAAGPRFEQLELSFTVFHLVITESTRHSEGESTVSPSPHAAPSAPPSFHVLIGSTEQIAEQLLARREHYGFSYIQVPDAQMEAFAPVVARLAGR